MTFWLPLALALTASVATYAGGAMTMRFAVHRHLIFGLTGGFMIGLALFDLLPAALELAPPRYSRTIVVALAVVAVGLYFFISRLPGASTIDRLTLVVHSFIDGLGIGVAFQISTSIGWLVAAAVLAHKLADGANLIGFTMTSGDLRKVRGWLLANSVAPLAGVILGCFTGIGVGQLSPILALFAGGFLYIGAAELLPRSRFMSDRSSAIAAVAGAIIITCVARLAG